MTRDAFLDLAERQVIDAIEAQFDIHAMEPEDFAEMWVAISRALTEFAAAIDDRNPTGGDVQQAPSRSDESGGAGTAIAQPQTPITGPS